MIFSRHDRVRRRSTLLMAILLLTLGLAGTMTYQALAADHWHRATAERALRNYAAVAAWDYSVNLKENLYGVLTKAFEPIGRAEIGAPGAPLPPPSVIARTTQAAAQCPDEQRDGQRYYFRLNLRDGTLATSGAPVSPSVREWIRHEVTAQVHSQYESDWIYAQLYGVAGERHRTLAYTLKRDAAGEPLAVYGFESCMGAWGKNIFRSVMEHRGLLPPALTADLPNDSLFSVQVTDDFGRPLWESPVQYPATYSAAFELGGGYGGMVTHVALSPRAAELLVMDGMPRSKMNFLLGLMALTAVLVGLGILQLRREGELARLRSDFVSSVSHELRTPLAQIRMFAETLLLNRVRSEEERKRSLEIIDQEARRLTHLVGNVLQFARAERRSSQLSPQPSDLAEEARGALEVFAPLAAARQVELETELAEGVVATVDRFALRQVLLNLLDNAVKYGPPGEAVTVTLELVGGRARLTVSDRGPGIAPRDRERIWHPFVRRERDANSAVAGSGIGLSVVRDLVGQHGGTAWVDGRPGGGSRFVVELPGARFAAPVETTRALERISV